MSRRSIVFIVILFLSTFVFSQTARGDDIGPELRYPKGAIKIQPKEPSLAEREILRRFIPEGYAIREIGVFDFNNDGRDDIVGFFDNNETAESHAAQDSRCIVLISTSKDGFKGQVVFDKKNKTDTYFGYAHKPPIVYKIKNKAVIRVKSYARGEAYFTDIYWDAKSKMFIGREVKM